MMNTASASSCGSKSFKLGRFRSASTATPYVSHFAQKSKYGGVIHLTKSPTELYESQVNKLECQPTEEKGYNLMFKLAKKALRCSSRCVEDPVQPSSVE